MLGFFENRFISKPIEFRDLSFKDKKESGLRNLFNYFEDNEREEICSYNLEKWRYFVKIKKSAVVEIYVNDEEIKKAYRMSCGNKTHLQVISLLRKPINPYTSNAQEL